MDRIRVPGNQWMPPIEVAAFRYETIAAAWRQPVQRADIGRSQSDAIGNLVGTMRIIPASAETCIQKLAGNVSEIDFAGILVLKLLQTAARAAVAQAFPFRV